MVWITLPNEFDEDSKQWIRHQDVPRMQNMVFNKTALIDHSCALSVESLPHKTIRGTAIACNIGFGANRNVENLLKLMQAGMNIARIHLALNHDDLEYHTETIKNIKEAAKLYSKILGVHYPIAIASNVLGSEIRTGYLEGGEEAEIELISGNLIKLTTDPAYKDKCSVQVIYLDNEDIISKITEGRFIYIDDGEIKLQIISISGAFMTCKILIGGILGNQRGVNLPGTKVDLPNFSEKDKLYINFAIECKLDFLFCSFIKNKAAVLEIRDLLGDKGKHIKLISKIEEVQGYQNIEEIMSVSDAIIIARGDLFLEFTAPKLIIAQKYLTAKCVKHGCPVMISRELIESMITSAVPTRAEVSDIASAVLDGVDVVMLARETVKGNNAINIVKFVSQICKEAEAVSWRTSTAPMFNDWSLDHDDDISNTISMTAVDSSLKCRAAAILVITDTGNMARIISKYRPRCPIVAVTRNARISRQLHLYRSVIPLLYTAAKKRDILNDIDAQVATATEFGKKLLFIRPNDPLIIMIDLANEKKVNHTMRIQYVTEEVEFIDGAMYIS